MAICWPIRRAHLFAGPDDDSRIIDAALDEEDQEEEQESYCGSNDKRISTLAFFLIVAIAFFAVSFELYQKYGLRIEA